MATTRNDDAPGLALADFAIVDPGIMGLNLFRPLPLRGREAARKRMFEVDTVHDGRKLRVAGAYTLRADDLAILLAVLALAGLAGKKIEVGVAESMRIDIVDGLESTGTWWTGFTSASRPRSMPSAARRVFPSTEMPISA